MLVLWFYKLLSWCAARTESSWRWLGGWCKLWGVYSYSQSHTCADSQAQAWGRCGCWCEVGQGCWESGCEVSGDRSAMKTKKWVLLLRDERFATPVAQVNNIFASLSCSENINLSSSTVCQSAPEGPVEKREYLDTENCGRNRSWSWHSNQGGRDKSRCSRGGTCQSNHPWWTMLEVEN